MIALLIGLGYVAGLVGLGFPAWLVAVRHLAVEWERQSWHCIDGVTSVYCYEHHRHHRHHRHVPGSSRARLVTWEDMLVTGWVPAFWPISVPLMLLYRQANQAPEQQRIVKAEQVAALDRRIAEQEAQIRTQEAALRSLG